MDVPRPGCGPRWRNPVGLARVLAALAAAALAGAASAGVPWPPPRPGTVPLQRPAHASPQETEVRAPVRGAPRAAPRPDRRPRDLGGIRRALLIGVLEIDGRRQALLRLPAGRVVRLDEGERIMGWTVGAVAPDGARLERPGERLELRLVRP